MATRAELIAFFQQSESAIKILKQRIDMMRDELTEASQCSDASTRNAEAIEGDMRELSELARTTMMPPVTLKALNVMVGHANEAMQHLARVGDEAGQGFGNLRAADEALDNVVLGDMELHASGAGYKAVAPPYHLL